MADGLLIQVDGSTEIKSVSGYQEICDAVGGGFDHTDQSDIMCYCYEYALYELPVNPVATAIFWRHNHASSPLAGPVLIMGAADRMGNETNVPVEVVAEAALIKREMGPEKIAELAVQLDEDEIPKPQIISLPPGWKPGDPYGVTDG